MIFEQKGQPTERQTEKNCTSKAKYEEENQKRKSPPELSPKIVRAITETAIIKQAVIN